MRDQIHQLRRRAARPVTVLAEGCLAALGVPRPQALLVLGHMRSGSTLLLHLLLSNPEVSAAGERNASYAVRADLARLAIATRRAHRAPLRRLRYVADQLNHNHLTPDVRLLQDARVRVLFLLRAAPQTLASLMELSRAYYEQSWSLARAADYYIERLARLSELAAALAAGRRAAFISYEALTAHPAATLEALQGFLGLEQGFSQNYATYAFTGLRGDPGPRIVQGTVLPPAGPGASAVPSDSPELRRASEAHQRCRQVLARLALLPEGTGADG